MANSPLKNIQPEPQHNSDMKAIVNPSTPTIANTLVVGSTVYLMDCVEGMKHYPDKYFDLAIVDPPYGINESGQRNVTGDRPTAKWKNPKSQHYETFDDSAIPTYEYWIELFRVSQNQIIWGGNYFDLPPTQCFLIWDKGESIYGRSFAECEQAWTSFKTSARIFKMSPNQLDRIHPTQKPIQLYSWAFSKFTKAGDRIIDTHLGSQSSRIAADKAGLDFTGFEIDKEYYDLGEKRFKQYKSQLRIEGW